MADKQDTKDDNILVTAAKAIGSAAGKIASLGKADTPRKKAGTKTAKRTKLVKKVKSRLPRKQKKALQKKISAELNA